MSVKLSVAYKVNDWLSVGAGAALPLGYLSEKTRVNTLDPVCDDGKLRYSDTDFAVQGNFGIMIERGYGNRDHGVCGFLGRLALWCRGAIPAFPSRFASLLHRRYRVVSGMVGWRTKR